MANEKVFGFSQQDEQIENLILAQTFHSNQLGGGASGGVGLPPSVGAQGAPNDPLKLSAIKAASRPRSSSLVAAMAAQQVRTQVITNHQLRLSLITISWLMNWAQN